MGMTIDDAITWLNTDDYESKGFADATSIAIDTMRKYQKIADLYDYWRSSKCEYTISCMENIGKVLKDG